MKKRNRKITAIAAFFATLVLLTASLPFVSGSVVAQDLTATQDSLAEGQDALGADQENLSAAKDDASETQESQTEAETDPQTAADSPEESTTKENTDQEGLANDFQEPETDSPNLADRQALAEAVYQASLLEKGSYSDESFQALQNEIAAAKALLEDDAATVVQLKQQLYLLTLAYSQLEGGFSLKPLPSLSLNEAEGGSETEDETKKLEDGTYEINGALRHASADQNSMGNNAISKPLQLIVKDGKATLRFEMVPLTAALGKKQFTGYLYHMDYYPGWEGGDTGFKAPIEETPVAVTIEEYYKDVYDEYNDPKTGLDKNIRGKLYPHYMSMPVDLLDEEIWVQVYVPVMEAISEGSGTQYAKLQLDWSSVKLKEEEKDDGKLDVKNLEDGIYKVTGNMVKVNKTDASMSDDAINHKIKLTVKNGTYFITLDFKGLTVGTQLGYLGTLKYFKTGYKTDVYGAPQGTTAEVTVDSYQTASDGKKISDTYGSDYPDKVTFELISEALEDGYVPLQVFVPIMEAISAGSGTQPVFLVLDWDTIKKTTASDPDFEDSEEEGGETSPAADLTDKATGIHISAGSGVLPEGVKLVVTAITEGSDYNAVKTNMFISGNPFVLYDISFVNADGKEVQPSGRVTVSIPLPKGWGTTGLAVYHFSDSGSASPIVGSAADGTYTFSSASFSKFALVERKSSGLPGGNSTLPTGNTTLPTNNLNKNGTSTLSTGNKLSTSGIGVAKTGDSSDPALWLAIMVGAVAVIFLILASRKNRNV